MKTNFWLKFWRSVAIVAIVVLILSGASNIVQWQSAKQELNKRMSDNLQFQNVVIEKNAQIKASGDTIQSLRAQLDVRAKVYDSKSDSLKARLNAKDREIAILRRIAKPIVDENPEIGDLISGLDVKIGLLDSLNTAQELYCTAQMHDLSDIIRIQGKQIESHEAIQEAQRQQIVLSEDEARKEKKGKKFWRGVAFVGAGVIAILSLTK